MAGFIDKVPEQATLRYERTPKVPNRGYAHHMRIYSMPDGSGVVERLQPNPAVWWVEHTAEHWVGLQRNLKHYEEKA